MLKPTPTALPPGTPFFTINPVDYSLWASTDAAIQSWNFLGDTRSIIQAIILIVLIVVGIAMLTRGIKQITGRESE